jgi:hypothetical protein
MKKKKKELRKTKGLLLMKYIYNNLKECVFLKNSLRGEEKYY